MKELIQQFESRCWETRQLTADAHSWHTSFNTKKFAELILADCIKAVEETSLGYGDYRDQILESMRNSCVGSIKNHFGVGE